MAPRKNKKVKAKLGEAHEEFAVRVEKKEIIDPAPPTVNRYRIEFTVAASLWNRCLCDISNVGIGEFLKTLGFYVPVLSSEWMTSGGFLMNFTHLYPEEGVQRTWFSWILQIMGSTLVAWGITSSCAAEWSRLPNEQDKFYRFMTAWGYAMFKNPENQESLPKYVLELMNKNDLEAW